MFSQSKGGNIIGSGGFGCVFRPALTCRGKTGTNEPQISKLMLNEDAEEEYKETTKFKHILEKIIPGNENFFIFNNVNMCEPEPLEPDDLNNFQTQCSTLVEQGITQLNINDPTVLSRIKIINMPFGGVTIDQYINQHKTRGDILNLNRALLDLYTQAIQPMNNNGVYHNDLKYSNILVLKEKKTLKTRIIDWGLSFYLPDTSLPYLNHSSIPFNRPFTYILLQTKFSENYSLFLKSLSPNSPNSLSFEIKTFVVSFVQPMLEKREGNMSFIENILQKLLPVNSLSWVDVMVDFLVKSILKFTQNGEFQTMEYVKSIYLPLLDTWGFLMCYWPVYKFYHEKAPHSKITTFFKKLFMDYLFEPKEIQPLNSTQLVSDLQRFGDYLQKVISKSHQGGAFCSSLKLKHKTQNKKTQNPKQKNTKPKTKKYKTQNKKKYITNK